MGEHVNNCNTRREKGFIMPAQAAPNGIILFHYPQSPYGRRVRWYLALRGIAYAECIQPWILPRPDMEALGVRYRRSPVMAIGRDIYVDSRMILQKLEELFPPSTEHPALSSKATEGMAALMNKFVVDAGVFSKAVGIMRPDRAALQDPAFVKDGGGSGPFKDQGRLWRLDKNEVAISVQAPSGEEVRIHAPRWHFRVKRASARSML